MLRANECNSLFCFDLPFIVCQGAYAEHGKLLCTIAEIIVSNALGHCFELFAEDVGLHDFLIVDLEAKKIREASSINLLEFSFIVNTAVEGVTILSSVGGMHGWSAVISKNNNWISSSVRDEVAVFVVFGNCRPASE